MLHGFEVLSNDMYNEIIGYAFVKKNVKKNIKRRIVEQQYNTQLFRNKIIKCSIKHC